MRDDVYTTVEWSLRQHSWNGVYAVRCSERFRRDWPLQVVWENHISNSKNYLPLNWALL